MVLTVAGYDQSAGAGVLADIKTLEAHGVYGYAVVTGLTIQNERVVRRVEWLALKEVFEQIDICCESASFDWVKIGITPSMEAAAAIIDHIHRQNPMTRVVMDPVIRASTGKEFWKRLDRDEWEEVAAKCYLVTPNWEEIGWLYPGEDPGIRCAELSSRAGCHIYLKGGHQSRVTWPGLFVDRRGGGGPGCGGRGVLRRSMGRAVCCRRRWRRTWL